MSTLKATTALYREALADTGRSLVRSVWAMLYLLLAQVGFAFAALLLAPGGQIAGFALGFVQAALIGWYLALLEIAVVARRPMRFGDLRDTFGHYLWETISVLFLFFVPQLLLGLAAPQLLVLLIPIASVVFSSAPEGLYQDRTQSTENLADAARFMQQNWPEWLGAHAFATVVLAGWAWALNGRLDTAIALDVVRIFGPFFGFVTTGGLALRLVGPGLLGLASILFSFAFTHAFMVFRGHLYRRLRNSSRRGRAWQARL